MRRLAIGALVMLRLYAQPPAFEVASVKAAQPGPLQLKSDPVRFTIRNQSLETLIELAFGLREYQYRGPAWLHTARYDIDATTSSPQPRSVQLAMLQALLAERFHLAVHRESKTIPVYELVVAKGGPKLHPLDDSQPPPFELYSNFHMEAAGGGTALRGIGSLGQLSDFLTRVVERPVLDRTGITGAFDLRLLCAVDGFPGSDTSPGVFDALEVQMGLRLEARNSSVEITVVDHVEKPSLN